MLIPFLLVRNQNVIICAATYLQLQDLLGEFTNPCVMDCKIGVRTYLEEELAKAKEKPKLRKVKTKLNLALYLVDLNNVNGL